MHLLARLLEAYLPGLGSWEAARHGRLQAGIATGLRQNGHEALVIVVPEDEMVLVVAWQGASSDSTPGMLDAATMKDVVMRCEPSVVVQRIMDAQVILSVAEE